MALHTNRVLFFVLFLCLVLPASPAAAFGAGNIASISRIEGKNWRHGDIEDLLKTVPFLAGYHKWSSIMLKRAYFGNWLRDYSQAIDVGTLKGIQADTIRILVWVLSFMAFGYATEEFEVTAERLGVYRPEEHIDNPRDYADNVDARQFDPRLRPPTTPAELAVDPNTGMKNYIANEAGPWATSSGYVKYSFARSIHFGRLYTCGANGTSGREADLCEALRCLGQGLHCLEDFAAHSNYVELVLRDLGFGSVFPHTGVATELVLHGRTVFPLVTGTFGAVDFLHSVLGEATDHIAQSEVDDMNGALSSAQALAKPPASQAQSHSGKRGEGEKVVQLLAQLPGAGASLSHEAQQLRAASDEQDQLNRGGGLSQHEHYSGAGGTPAPPPPPPPAFSAPPGSVGGPPGPGIPGMSPTIDPAKTIRQIYPILLFRDKVARAISATLEKVPGLQALCEKLSETITLFVLSLLAPFIRPIITAVSKQLKQGSSAVVDASGRHQFEPWTDPYCTDPTHSLLSKDHFSNVLNGVAGQVAAVTLKYVAPRIIFAWSRPDVPLEQVLGDVVRTLHHPAIRDTHCQLHTEMYETVRAWAHAQPGHGAHLNDLLSSDSVKNGRNHIVQQQTHGHGQAGLPHHHQHAHGGGHAHGSASSSSSGGHSKVRGSEWEKVSTRAAPSSHDDPYAQGTPQGYPSPPHAGYHQYASPSPQGYGGYEPPPPPPASGSPYGYGAAAHAYDPSDGRPPYTGGGGGGGAERYSYQGGGYEQGGGGGPYDPRYSQYPQYASGSGSEAYAGYPPGQQPPPPGSGYHHHYHCGHGNY